VLLVTLKFNALKNTSYIPKQPQLRTTFKFNFFSESLLKI
jgi:hypothetical protein